MSIWTYKTALFVLILAIAGCGDGGKQVAFLSKSNFLGSVGGTALRQTRLADGSVDVSGISSYCVDKTLLKTRMAVLFPCAALGAKRAEWPQVRAAFTVTVGQPGGADLLVAPDKTQAFLKTDSGRKILSRSNDMETVTVARTVARGDAIYVLASDTSPNPFGDNHMRNWRAFTMLNGRLTTVTATGYGAVTLPEDTGFDLLEKFVRHLRAENGAEVQSIVTRSGAATPNTTFRQ